MNTNRVPLWQYLKTASGDIEQDVSTLDALELVEEWQDIEECAELSERDIVSAII